MSQPMCLQYGTQVPNYMAIPKLSKSAQTFLSFAPLYRADEATPTPRQGAMDTGAPTVITQGEPVTPEVYDLR